MQKLRRLFLPAFAAFLALAPVAAQDPAPATLTLGGYAVGREVYGALLEAFRTKWQAETGQQLNVLETYQASGALSRQIEGGFTVDIFAAQLDPEVDRLVNAGLVGEDWRETDGYNGLSNVVIVTRAGNPKNIQDWADLTQDGVEVIIPNPGTSGGAQWLFLSPVGAVLRGEVEGFSADDAGVDAFLRAFVSKVGVFDRDGRESFLTFERGVGDVAITYENEALKAIEAGGDYEIVYPTSSVLIERPLVIIDGVVDANGNREIAEAFLEFARSEEAQQIYAANGYRPLSEEIELPEAVAELYPVLESEQIFSIADQFGSWKDARDLYFGDAGLITTIIAEVAGV